MCTSSPLSVLCTGSARAVHVTTCETCEVAKSLRKCAVSGSVRHNVHALRGWLTSLESNIFASPHTVVVRGALSHTR